MQTCSEEDIEDSSSFIQYVLGRSFDDSKYSCDPEMTCFARLKLFSDNINFSSAKTASEIGADDELYLNDDKYDLLLM